TRVVSNMTGDPVEGAQVSASNSGPVRSSSYGETDRAGRVILRLPPGSYALDVRKRGSDYVWFAENFAVRTDAEQPREVRLVTCAILKVETVDADTGRPLAGVFIGTMPGRRSGLGISDSTGFVVVTRTNEQGAVRFPVAPGRLAVMATLAGY